jgi:hypothetical protein
MRPEKVARAIWKETPAQRADRTSRSANESRTSLVVQIEAMGVPVEPLV